MRVLGERTDISKEAKGWAQERFEAAWLMAESYVKYHGFEDTIDDYEYLVYVDTDLSMHVDIVGEEA